ncbi:MAG: DsbA family oxidoreductase [Janthinobacterium lividum]
MEIWSDIVCPWCYIGKRRFESALAQFPHAADVEVEWKAFELDPTAVSQLEPATGPSDAHARVVAAKFGQSVAQVQQMIGHVDDMAAAEGLKFRQDVSVPANTLKAHQLVHLAAERGVQDAVKERFMKAYFTEGQPVGDVETLVRLGVEAGLDAAEARDVLAHDTYLDAVRADEEQAAALGARGVPFFVFDRTYGISGAQPVEHFLEVLERAWADARPLTLVGGDDTDVCGPRGCAV